MNTIDITTDRQDGILSARLDGRIDGSNAAKFEEEMRMAIEESDRAVIIDFENLLYISSAGLRAVLITAKRLGKQDTQLVLCSLPDQIRAIFRASGFDKIITIQPSKREALDSLEE